MSNLEGLNNLITVLGDVFILTKHRLQMILFPTFTKSRPKLSTIYILVFLFIFFSSYIFIPNASAIGILPTPDYFGTTPNYANSPLPTTSLQPNRTYILNPSLRWSNTVTVTTP